jgi:hypothetical protein
LRHYIAKKNYFHRRFKKWPSDYFYDRFAYYRKLVKNTIKSDRLRWLKSIYNNLKSQPQHFWKYISHFGKQIRFHSARNWWCTPGSAKRSCWCFRKALSVCL